MAKTVTACPHCSARYRVSEEKLGRRTRCKKCGKAFVMTGPKEGPEPADSGRSVAPATEAAIRAAEEDVPLVWDVDDVILDLYEVTGILGEGGFGTVYKVHHKGWDMDLAVKCPKPGKFETERQVENFERECETWINLGLHPNTVSCYYVRRLGGIPRVFIECVEGGSLEDWIQDDRLYEGSPEEALKRILDIAIQFAWGLQYAHEQGLVHQDVKPPNVMMTSDGTAKVTDFGLAKARAEAGEEFVPGSSQSMLVTYAGAFSPAYCSPEQASKEKLSRKTDIWSWGVSVLEMFTGGVIWPSGSAVGDLLPEYLEMGEDGPFRLQIPEMVVDLLRQCFQHDREARPRDMQQIAERLKNTYHQATGEDYLREEPKAAELLADGLNNRALSMLDLGKQDEAEKLFDEALQADPHHAEATYNRGLILWRSGRMADDALVRQLEEVRTTHGGEWRDEYLLGLVHMERGDAESAVGALEEAALHGSGEQRLQNALTVARSGLGKWRCCLRTIEAHDPVMSVCLDADGRHALSGSRDQTLRLWELETGRCLRTLEGHASYVQSVCISPDGRRALSGSWDKSLRLWDLETGRCLRTFEGHEHWVMSVCLSGDGCHALTGSCDKTLRLWEVKTGRCLRSFEGHTFRVKSVCLSADGRHALSGSMDQTLKVWEVETGRCLRTFVGHADDVAAVCLSADGRHALSGSTDRTLKLWEVETGRCLRTFEGHTDPVESVCLSADGRHALSGSMDRTLRLWEVETGRCLRTFEGHTGRVTSVCLSPDGRRALSGSIDDTLRLWKVDDEPSCAAGTLELARMAASSQALSTDTEYRRLLRGARAALASGGATVAAEHLRRARSLPGCRRRKEALRQWRQLYRSLPRGAFAGGWCEASFKGHTGSVTSVCLDADGRHALSGSTDQTIRLWDVDTGRCLRAIEAHIVTVESVCLSADGRHALSGSWDEGLKLWDLATGRCLRTLEGYASYVQSVCISPDGRRALSGNWDNSLRLWDLETGSCLRTLEGHTDGVQSVSFSPDGRHALSGSDDQTLRLWELETGRCLRTLEGHASYVQSVCISPDGRRALSGSWDKGLRLWDLETGRCLRTFEGHTDGVQSVSLNPDGRHALSGSHDQTLRLWEVETGRCLRTFEGHTGRVMSVCLSADGRYGLSGSRDGTLKLWALDWEVEDRQPADWDEGARPYLETFLVVHTPYAARLPMGRTPSEEEVRLSLTRRGTANWNDEDFKSLLFTLGCAGYGWLRPEGVRKKLEEMTRNWQGPPPLPAE